MARKRLSDLLLARAFSSRFDGDDSTPSERGIGLTRRQFIGNAAGFGAGVLVADVRDAPRVFKHGTAVVVDYRQHRWVTDPVHFGSGATASFKAGHDRFDIHLKCAYLPGTDLPADFTALLIKTYRGWSVRLAMSRLGFKAAAPLDGWLAGRAALRATVNPRTIVAAGSRIAVAGASIELSVRPRLGLDFGGTGTTVSLDRPWNCQGVRCRFDLQTSIEGSFREVLVDEEITSATTFAIDRVNEFTDQIVLGCDAGQTSSMVCAPGPQPCVRGEVFDVGHRADGVVILEGPASVGVRSPTSDTVHQSIHLERAVLAARSGSWRPEVSIAGRVSRSVQFIDCHGWQAGVVGDDDAPFYAQFVDGRSGTVRLRARLTSLSLPIPGADLASVDVPERPVEIRFLDGTGAVDAEAGPGLKTLGAPNLSSDQSTSQGGAPSEAESDSSVADTTPKTGSVLIVGRAPYLLVGLENSELRLSRGLDLFDLTFAFTGFQIEVHRGKAFLVRRPPAKKGEKWPPATVTVKFPPQHIAESFADVQNPAACMNDRRFLTEVARARLSIPSRVVFDVPGEPDDPIWVRQRLTIDALTEWSELALSVNERAMEPDSTLEEQLKIPNIGTATTKAQALAQIQASLRPPGQGETSLSLAERLVFSPSPSAKWLTPGRLRTDDGRKVPLWHARLDKRGRKTVRAIWSYSMVPGKFPCPDEEPAENTTNDLVIIAPAHQGQLVAQTSAYGVPATRRRGDEVRSRVVRPEKDYAYLKEIDNQIVMNGPPDTGIVMPAAFKRADIILTSIGASFDALWEAEPALVRADGNLEYSVQRLQYISHLGRDIKVELVRKGYFCPLGHRCSFVELTERRFFKHPTFSYPVTFLVKRRFIVVRKEKLLPGVKQPFQSRDFPAERVVSVTETTPDLVRPDANGGEVAGISQPNKLVFWPRLTAGEPGKDTGDFDFKWTLDRDDHALKSPRLCVENTALADSGLLARIVNYYRSLGTPDSWHPLRTARDTGARRRYAAAASEGDTSFDTDSWLLSVRGQLESNGQGEVEKFVMDGQMEGQDQPPFYPVVERARVSVQSLDRLVGPRGLVEVSYNEAYVRHGFSARDNPGEIFLNFHRPEIVLDLTGKGDSAGGLAKPNALVVALSRKLGPVGGTRKPKPPTPSPASPNLVATPGRAPGGTPTVTSEILSPLASQDLGAPRGFLRRIAQPTGQTSAPALNASSPYEFGSAQSGVFRSKEFLGGLDNVNLLGILSLKDLVTDIAVDAAPKLIETIGYGVDGDPTAALGRVRQVVTTAGSGLITLIDDVRTQLDAALAAHTAVNVRFRDLYPVLDDRCTRFNASLSAAISAVNDNAATLARLSGPFTRLVADGKSLLAEMERTVSNPVPPLVQTRIAAVAKEWETLKNTVTTGYEGIGKELFANVLTQTVLHICEEIERTDLGAAFFGVTADVTCKEIVADPVASLDRIGESLFFHEFGVLFHDLLAYAYGVQAELTGKIAWARHRVLVAATATVKSAAESIQWQLKEDNNQCSVPHILCEASQRILATALVDVLEAMIAATSTQPGVSADAILTALRVLPERFTTALDQEIDKHDALFPLADGQTRAAVRQAFKDGSIEPIQTAARLAIEQEVDRVRALFVTSLQQTRAQAVERAVGVIDRFVSAIGASVEFAEISRLGQAYTRWCSRTAEFDVPPVLAFADGIARRVLAPLSTLVAQVDGILALARRMQSPGSAMQPQLERSIAVLNAWAQQLARTMRLVDDESEKLRSLAGTLQDACEDVSIWLNPVTALMNLRARAVDEVYDIVRETLVIDQLLKSPQAAQSVPVAAAAMLQPHSPSLADIKADLTQIVKEAGLLLKRLTSIEQATVPTGQVWVAIGTAVDVAKAITGLPQTVSIAIEKAKSDIQTVAKQYNDAIDAINNAGNDPSQLLAVAGGVVAYARDHDKHFAAFVLQTAAIGAELGARVETQLATAIKAGVPKAIALHRDAETALTAIKTALQIPEVALVVRQEVISAVESAAVEVSADLESLEALEKAAADLLVAIAAQPPPPPPRRADTAPLRKALGDLEARWRTNPPRPPALVRAVTMLADSVEALLRGNLSEVVDLAKLRPHLQDIEARVRALVASVIPTKAELSYKWQTGLGSFPAGSPVFAMTHGKTTDDLTLSVDAAVDFVTGERTAAIVGRLKPFEIRLLGDLKIATIRFKRADFRSDNGAAPQFNMEVEEVVLGALMDFIKPLQEWLSPDGDSGFYIRPTTRGIEAGYIFDAGVIRVGTLSFINVALGVAARLPFDNNPAEFEFRFASIDRPFLISSPPYGGGGFVKLIANAREITGFSLSFVFGAVVDIKFGPLHGHGRVCAGILVERAPGTCAIAGVVEAVGEGNIACFSISVLLRVKVQSDGGSNLTGSAHFDFTFKVGIADVTYGFDAAHKVSGGAGAAGPPLMDAAPALLRREAPEDPGPQYVTEVPHKSTEWNRYKRRLAMDLLLA